GAGRSRRLDRRWGGGGGVSAEPRAPLRDTLAPRPPPAAALAGGRRRAAGGLGWAALLGAGSAAAAIGLIATSAWLISRASQRPPESAIALGVVAVQFFALSRALLRYAERLVGHDAAFRVLADLRVGV